MASRIVDVFSDNHFREEFEKIPAEQLLVVDFFATWCHPCKMIAPKLAELSWKYPSVKFLKVDVDICQRTAVSYGIQAMPTFLFFKNKQKIETLRGADPQRLEQFVQRLMGTYSYMDVDVQRVALGRSFACFEEILANPRKVFEESANLILRYANNILKDPDNLKYRQIKLSNNVFTTKLLPVEGAVNCFFGMGFEEMDDKLFLSPAVSLSQLHALRDALTDELKNKNGKQESSSIHQESVSQSSSSATSNTTKGQSSNLLGATCGYSSTSDVIGRSRVYNGNVITSTADERNFFATLKSEVNNILMYEEDTLQKLAQSVIPLETLQTIAKENSDKSIDEFGNVAISFQDCLLLQLLDWFKKDFFTWMNSPNCPRCKENGEIKNTGIVEPTQEERSWGAGVVEGYQCQLCTERVRFPRYNHPQKLLETRTGRCGEWANCFTLCCRAVGFEARLVKDWTDHVWTEVYSKQQQRWLHCDACENTCDKPLVYEAGWGKQLSYVIAFSKDEVLDVTWRYSSKHEEVKARRNLVSENWLVSACQQITDELRIAYSEEEKKEFSKRHIKEIVELITIKNPIDGELGGRVSGSMAWRQLRGEAGTPSKIESYIFKLTEDHKVAKRFRLRYNPVKDTYYTNLDSDLSTAEPSCLGWHKCVYTCTNIQKKVESDWNMVYLARSEQSDKATISWKIDISESEFCFDHVTVKSHSKTFENGTVNWKVYNTEHTNTGSQNEEGLTYMGSDFSGHSLLTIEAELLGGMGDVAWQHTQLFRCKETETSFCGLDVEITLKKIS